MLSLLLIIRLDCHSKQTSIELDPWSDNLGVGECLDGVVDQESVVRAGTNDVLNGTQRLEPRAEQVGFLLVYLQIQVFGLNKEPCSGHLTNHIITSLLPGLVRRARDHHHSVSPQSCSKGTGVHQISPPSSKFFSST